MHSFVEQRKLIENAVSKILSTIPQTLECGLFYLESFHRIQFLALKFQAAFTIMSELEKETKILTAALLSVHLLIIATKLCPSHCSF